MIPVDPAGRSQSFQVHITENELPWDAYNWDVPDLNSQRYAPNLNHTWRLLANPYFGSVDLKFTYFNLNDTQLGDLDFVEIGYHGVTPEHQMIGLLPPATARSLTWSAGMDMHDPGVALRFFSGGAYPLSDPLGMWFETEGDGFSIDEVVLVPSPGFVDLQTPVTLGPWDNVLVFLQAGGDVVEAELGQVIPYPGHRGFPMTVAVWIPHDQSPDSDEVTVYARCGSPVSPVSDILGPESSTRSSAFVPTPEGDFGPAGAFLNLPRCRTNWFIAIRNASSTARMVRMTARPTTRTYGTVANPINIGIAFEASPDQLDQIIETVRGGIFRFYGYTEGTVMLNHLRFFNNAVHCDDSWPADRFACQGEDCRICYAATLLEGGAGAVTRTWTDGFITIKDPDGLGPRVNTNQGTVAHESGHSYLQLGDEYTRIDGCSGGSTRLCGYSAMSHRDNNLHGFCTALNHRTGLEDWRPPIAASGIPRVTNGPDLFACDGSRQWTDTRPAWDWINRRTLATYPSANQTPSNHSYDFILGRADILGGIFAIEGP